MPHMTRKELTALIVDAANTAVAGALKDHLGQPPGVRGWCFPVRVLATGPQKG